MRFEGLSHSVSFVLALAAVGCSGAREVELTGVAEAAANATIGGPITIEVFEADVDEGETPEAIHSFSLEQLGPFQQKVEVEGDAIRIVALADTDEDGACTEGEAWVEAEASVGDDDKIADVVLRLAVAPCPK